MPVLADLAALRDAAASLCAGPTAVDGDRTVTVLADGRPFPATVRLDTPREADYHRHGGVLPYVLRRLLAGK